MAREWERSRMGVVGMPEFWIMLGLRVGAAITSASLAAVATYRPNLPGKNWLSITGLGLAAWVLINGVQDMATSQLGHFEGEFLGLALMLMVSVSFCCFVLQFSGATNRTTRGPVTLLWIIPILAVLANTQTSFVGTMPGSIFTGNISIADVGFWVGVTYSYSLVIIGALLLLGAVSRSPSISTRYSTLLGAGFGVGFGLHVLTHISGMPPGGIDLTPVGVAVFAGALLLYLNGPTPIPTRPYRWNRATIDTLNHDGLLVVDHNTRILDANSSARAIFGSSQAESVAGTSIDTVMPADAFATAEPIQIGSRYYDITMESMPESGVSQSWTRIRLQDVTEIRDLEIHRAQLTAEVSELQSLTTTLRTVQELLRTEFESGTLYQEVAHTLGDSALFEAVYVADMIGSNGSPAHWYQECSDREPPFDNPDTARNLLLHDDSADRMPDDPWIVEPIHYDGTTYGIIAAYPQTDVSDHARSLLTDIALQLGQAKEVHAVQQLLSASSVVAGTITSTDAGAVLPALSREFSDEVHITGVVQTDSGSPVAFLSVAGMDPATVQDRCETAGISSARVIQGSEAGGLLAWDLTGPSILQTLASFPCHITGATAVNGSARYEVVVAADRQLRRLLQDLQADFPETVLESKQQQAEPLTLGTHQSVATTFDLTVRQREVLEAAYRAGYFEWPRESTAEDVAAILGLSAPTVHGHLRKAEQTVFGALLDK